MGTMVKVRPFLAAGARMETSDKFRREPAKGGGGGPEILNGRPLDFEEAQGRLRKA